MSLNSDWLEMDTILSEGIGKSRLNDFGRNIIFEKLRAYSFVNKQKKKNNNN